MSLRPSDRRWCAAVVMAIGAVGLSLAPMGTVAQATVLLCGVALIGAPHGIFDIDLALWAAPTDRPLTWLAGLLAAYLGLIALVAMGWLLVPAVTLVLFLAAAALHFGSEGHDGDEAVGASAGGARSLVLLAAARGLSIIGLPILLHRHTTGVIFAALAGAPAPRVDAVLAAVTPALAAVWVSLSAASLLDAARRRDPSAAGELMALAALFAVAPPLAAFTVYFCLVHAPLHVWAMVRRSQRPPRRSWAWAGIRLAPAAAAAAAGLVIVDRLHGLDGASTWMFQALAALTLPHLVLTPWLERRGRVRSASSPEAERVRGRNSMGGPRRTRA